ncbi:uncharacterized protein LOC128124458 [Peromyscus californicus insignis]|uniref:uncharacterized protein LOC128124458 n=1 Tax=Peromyscus californicus insignis TaxID=564181 RepID=UPI0022A7A84B|nr:uncharacterized protein LOC128124458 [Peromyscus californicus insignis]XP_052616711.1 uncharacterized protein LOC128124458 [Peromyscus californicus insignis]
MILSNNLLPEERRRVWEQARIHADEIHQTNLSHPAGAEAVPDQEPHWDYNTQGGCLARDRFITCLLTGLCKAALKPVNYEKLKMVIQDKDENPSHFLEQLTKALLQFTSLDPESPEGRQLLITQFVSQSFPNIRDKLKRLENGPLTPQADVLVIAFKVYHGKDEKAHKRSCQMLASTARPALRKPSGPCFKYGREGHWAQACTTGPRRAPTKPCPKCCQKGHWSADCPNVPSDIGMPDEDHPPADFVGLAYSEDCCCLVSAPATPISHREPRVIIKVNGSPILFLLDTGATYSVLREFWGSTSPARLPIVGVGDSLIYLIRHHHSVAFSEASLSHTHS